MEGNEPATDGNTPDTGGNPRVCFVSLCAYAYFDPDAGAPPGGAERQLYLVGQQLKSEFDVHFVVGDYGQPETQRRDGITLHRAYTPDADLAPYRRPSQMAALYRAMRRADADVYVFRGNYAKAAVTYLFARLLGKRWVYNLAIDSHAESGNESSLDPVQAVFRHVITSADRVIAQTPRQRRRLWESFGVDSTVVPNGYPPLNVEHEPSSDEYLLYVGRIDRSQKRTHRFLELARELPDQSFVIVGPENNDSEYYRRIADEARSLDNVRFLGEVDPDEIHRYYERAIALVNVSSQEGFPNTFLEAWRTATPVIGLDVDPGRFLDVDSACYADGDFDELVDIAETLAESERTRESMGERAKQRFEEQYDVSVTAAKYADVLRRCLGRETPRRGGSTASPSDAASRDSEASYAED